MAGLLRKNLRHTRVRREANSCVSMPDWAVTAVSVVTGSVFVEKIFGWHGMGEWALQGYATQDVNIVAIITLFSGVLILAAGLLSDVIYAALDPRVRVS